MDINEAIGAAVKHHRLAMKKSQKTIDYDQGGLSKVENGSQSLSFESLEKIAKSIGVRGSEILATAEVMMGGKLATSAESQAKILNRDMLLDVINVASKGGLTRERLMAAYELVVARAGLGGIVELKPPRPKPGAAEHGVNTGRSRGTLPNTGRKNGSRKN